MNDSDFVFGLRGRFLAFPYGALCACSPPDSAMLRVAANQWPGYETLFLARECGALDESAIRLVEMPSATEVMHALRSGNIEAAMLTLDETLSLVREDIDLRMILVMDVSAGGDAIVVHPDLWSLGDLRGKTIGVENTATGGIVLDIALEQANMTVGDIHLKLLNATAQVVSDSSGAVDAVVAFEPSKSRLLELGASVLFDSSQIPGRILDVLVVRSEAIGPHERAIKHLVAAHFEALSQLHGHPLESAKRIAPRLGIAPEAVVKSYQGLSLPNVDDNRRFLTGPSPLLRSLAQRLAEYRERQRFLSLGIDLNHLIDPRFLPAARS